MKRLALILIACLALFAAGCGSSDDSSTVSESTATAEETTTESSAPKEESKSGGGEKRSAGGEKTKPKVTVPSGPPPKKLEIKEIERERALPPSRATK